MHLEQLIASFRHSPAPADAAPDGLLNTDLFPRDELRAR
jgi:hypothetical protein